jgi:hypothetical protein
MFITALSCIVAALLLFFPFTNPVEVNTPIFASLVALVGTAVLIIFPVLNALYLTPLQALEQKLIPRLMELYRKDKLLNISSLFTLLFPFASYVFAALCFTKDIPIKPAYIAAWVVFLGVTLDLIRDNLKRAANFLNPYHFIETFTQRANRSIVNDKDNDLWGSIDSLSEIAVRSVKAGKTDLTMQVLNAFPSILESFFTSSKSLTRVNQDQEIKKETGKDEAGYTVFYLLQRIELINMKALEHGLGTICGHVIMILGKIIVAGAKFDLSMVPFPTHVLGKLALRAQQYHFDEVATLGTATLLGVAKTIINDVNLNYTELQEPFGALIKNLNLIAQATFKKDKTISPKLLAQPFRELRELFRSEKVANHQDTPAILLQIDGVLEEFAALEQVMRTIPPISEMKPT